MRPVNNPLFKFRLGSSVYLNGDDLGDYDTESYKVIKQIMKDGKRAYCIHDEFEIESYILVALEDELFADPKASTLSGGANTRCDHGALNASECCVCNPNY